VIELCQMFYLAYYKIEWGGVVNYTEILERFSYQSDDEIKERIKKIGDFDSQEVKDIINSIVLWKLNRSIQISEETLQQLTSVGDLKSPLEAVKDMRISELIQKLLSSRGIQLPMASTILHFYYPDIFPIIDQRAYRELVSQEYPNFLSKDKIEKYVELYLSYIEKCYHYNISICPEIPFEYIDKILYQLDKEKGLQVKY